MLEEYKRSVKGQLEFVLRVNSVEKLNYWNNKIQKFSF